MPLKVTVIPLETGNLERGMGGLIPDWIVFGEMGSKSLLREKSIWVFGKGCLSVFGLRRSLSRELIETGR